MLYGAKDFYEYSKINNSARHQINILNGIFTDTYRDVTVKQARKALKQVKEAILNRSPQVQYGGYSHDYVSCYKYFRPWVVVPKLRNIRPPQGDYTIGVEVEMGFRTITNAQRVARHIGNWRHVCLDFEGGNNPIEATFPPALASKVGKDTQFVRYIRYLSENRELTTMHDPLNGVGTHININCHTGFRHKPYNVLTRMLQELSPELKEKYFGRSRPYGYVYIGDTGDFVEMKMFNSATDVAIFNKYLRVALMIARVLERGELPTQGRLIELLDFAVDAKSLKTVLNYTFA